ncbi:MAG: phosphoserine phosphatase [Methanobrevibacter sp.]|uniref:phosphoserine phosphatase n=1 Tax=Methanobrevibacter sp. TaxID=66852 RepID=UPI002E76EABB|nr:phosphoserine phosphatase [Methanobrevibacter sp.]MEE0934931.1 phosphoserine phosphatase [Methanobrevibacter sp.]
MKVGKGIVKKYSREYNRTLKNGERKKYTTEQIQITVPKNEDIYQNKEEVLIIPHSEIENFKEMEEENQALKVANYLYVEEVKKLEEQLKENNNTSALEFQREIETLKAELAQKNNDLTEMENKFNALHEDNLNDLKQENSLIKDKHSKLIIENENLKTKFVNIKTENENLKTKYSSIKEENKNLKTKCSNLREEHSSIKESYNQVSSKYDQLKQENLNTKTSYAEMYELNEDLEKDYDSLRLEYNDLVDKYNELEEELYNIKNTKSRDEYIANKVKEFILNSKN